jgi:hypothetical protein
MGKWVSEAGGRESAFAKASADKTGKAKIEKRDINDRLI